MLPNSLRTRGIVFAFLFGPPRVVGRDEASRLHNRVCDKLSVDDFIFRYSTVEPGVKQSSRGFSIVIERPEGRGSFRIVVDHQGAGNPIPIRLLMEYQWPPSAIEVDERFDIASETVFDSLEGEWQRVMAEARIRGQCGVQEGSALKYLTRELLNLSGARAEALGAPVTFASVALHASPAASTADSLDHPARELTVEVLREDPSALYLEFMSRWTQVPVGAPAIQLDSIRTIDKKPSEYIEHARSSLNTWLSTFGGSKGGTR